ncbi:MAG: hypothetical protein KatS3mg082_1909 [Nitrospiraceae bacterium]|nr:MAG: hypothetical protein KatS3mg082_1909 [Nitrospiraceae bacterium]
MPDYIGSIAVPEIVPSGVFPLVPDYPLEVRRDHEVVVHQFGSGNARIEQRYLLGAGARCFTIRKQWLRDADRVALRNFWESKYGPHGAFTYNAPNENGIGTTPVTCRFANEPLSWEMVADWACSLGVTLIEIPQTAPSYSLNQTVNRFPPAALQTALLAQVQEIIPLVRIQPLEPGYPAIHVSDRRCTIGGQLYQARLVEFDGISQSIGNESDEAQFSFGNADRVMRDLANDVDLFRAEIAFSLFHVGTGIKLDLWKGNIVNWNCDSGPEFRVTAADGLYELNLPYPTRKISRTCWKPFNSASCPVASQGALDLVHFPEADPTRCDKGFDTPNGCRAHGMNDYYGGIMAKPQGVRIKDNSTGVWGFGRSTLTSVSLVADSIYDQVLPEIYTDSPMPVNAKIASGRDESDFYAALGLVGEGPLGAYGTGHKLDGQYHHGYPGSLGLMTSLGPDPNPVTFGMDTDAGPERAAGTAFLMIRRSDAKGLQLSRLSEHAMEAVVAQGLSGWVWTSPGVRGYGPPLTNPIWIAVNMLLRARGLRLGAGATSEQLDFAETLFDVEAAIAAAAVCDEQVSRLVGTGTETQFKFRGVLQEEKPLRDWLQEVLMNCLGNYTFSNGKLKLGVRVNSSVVEAFTEGNILFRSLQLAPLKPSFNHLTANFADEDFEFVANSISLYDIDHATLIGGGAGPLFLKSTVNLSGTASKSQAARIITVRLREELGGITPEEWKKARQTAFKTTVLALNTEPGMVCSMTHPDMPGGTGEFRVTGWRLNRDYSIDIQGRTTTDSMYDLVAGPKPADVVPEPPAEEVLIDTGAPGTLAGTPRLGDYGTFILDDITVNADASGNQNIAGAREITMELYYVDELLTDLWGLVGVDVNSTADQISVYCTVNPNTQQTFRVGDLIIFNDEAADPNNARRSYEVAQIVGPGNDGDPVSTGTFVIQRGAGSDGLLGTKKCPHLAGVRFYKIQRKAFTFSVTREFFRTPGRPARIEAKLPSACIVAARVGLANNFGYGPFTVFPLSRHNEPYMPGLRTCNGGAYVFQVPGPLTVQENVVIPLKVQDAASVRCIYGYLQQGTSDGNVSILVKRSRDGGETWEPLELMGIPAHAPEPYVNSYDALVDQGYGTPATRRLPYADYGLALAQAVPADPGNLQTVATSSYGANQLGLEQWTAIHIDPGGPNEEYTYVWAADPVAQTITAVFRRNHTAGERIRPTVWPTPVLHEEDDLAFDVLAVGSPNPGSDLTIVIQT